MFQYLESVWSKSKITLPLINGAINATCEIGNISSRWNAAFNLPFRVMNLIAHRELDHQILFESAAVASLFVPFYGRYAAIAIDLLSVVVSYRQGHRETSPTSPTDSDVALTSAPDQLTLKWGRLCMRTQNVAFGLLRKQTRRNYCTLGTNFAKTATKLFLLALKKLEKIAAKEAAEEIAKKFGNVVVEKIGKKAAEEAGQEIAKQIPVFGLAIGTILAIHRFSSGQFLRGCGEIVSGTASCIPVYGTILSLGMDALLLGVDIREIMIRPALQDAMGNLIVASMSLNLPSALEILGIDPKTNPERQQVQQAFREFSLLLHSDDLHRILFLDGLAEEERKENRKNLNDALLTLGKIGQLLKADGFAIS